MIPLSTLVRMQLEKLGVGVPLVEPTHTGSLSGHSALQRGETQITELQKPPQGGLHDRERPGILGSPQPKDNLLSDRDLGFDKLKTR
jgi:hypothetical protein